MNKNKNENQPTSIHNLHKLQSNIIIDKKYICGNCIKIYTQTYQAECGCRYCDLCVERINAGICLFCKDSIDKNERVPDKGFQKEVNRSQVICRLCEWSGQLIDFEQHFKDSHKIQCVYCKNIFEDEQELENHLDEINGDCMFVPIKCPFHINACSNEFGEINRLNLQKHLNKYVVDHLKLFYDTSDKRLIDIKHKIDAYQSQLQIELIDDELDSIIESTSNTVNTAISIPTASTSESAIEPIQNVDLTVKSKGLSKKAKKKSKLKNSSNKNEQKQATSTANKISTPTKTNANNNNKIDLYIQNRIKQLESDENQYVDTFKTLIDRNTKAFKHFEEMKNESKTFKEKYTEIINKHTQLQDVLVSIESNISRIEISRFDGVLIWKLMNVYERIDNAKSGRESSVYSPAFYTSQYGYKMCIRVYLNGDGLGRGTHLSVFFIIMKGEYDSLLRWPFRQKVTFVLLDQSNNDTHENVIESFRPDPNSSSFRRPTSEMNIASGIPLFCPLERLLSSNRYIINDCLYLKAIVDCRDLIDI